MRASFAYVEVGYQSCNQLLVCWKIDLDVELLCPGGWSDVVVDGWKIDLDSAVGCGGHYSTLWF